MRKLLLLVLTLASPGLSSAMIVYDPANYAENLITATNSATQLMNQAQMLQNQIQEMRQNWAHLGNYKYQELANVIGQMDGLTQQGRSISYSMSDLNQRFNTNYPNYATQAAANNYPQAYRNWDDTTINTIHNSLSAVSVSTAQAGQEQALVSQLRQQTESANGNMQVMQVSNEISLETVQQLQMLKRMTAANANAQTAYMASEASRQSYADGVLSDAVGSMPTQFSSYHGNPNFGLLATTP